MSKKSKEQITREKLKTVLKISKIEEKINGFKPCELHPTCRFHKCDCYESWLLLKQHNK
jgi:hypothetical protein